MEGIENSKIIVLDTETTGLYAETDEILQLSMINGSGETLFSHLIKPSRRKKWDDAEKVNHISPAMVKNLKTFRFYRREIVNLLYGAELIVGYNLRFDLPFIKNACKGNSPAGYEDEARLTIALARGKVKYYDVMLMYAPVYGEWAPWFSDWKWQKLYDAAAALGYDWNNGAPHDSLNDCRATLFAFDQLVKMDLAPKWAPGGEIRDDVSAYIAEDNYNYFGGWYYKEKTLGKSHGAADPCGGAAY